LHVGQYTPSGESFWAKYESSADVDAFDILDLMFSVPVVSLVQSDYRTALLVLRGLLFARCQNN